MLRLLFANNYFKARITPPAIRLPAKADVHVAVNTHSLLASLPTERKTMKATRFIEVNTDISFDMLLYYLSFSAYNSYVDVVVDTFYWCVLLTYCSCS